jgi:mono/diheme cytochrome c family protein
MKTHKNSMLSKTILVLALCFGLALTGCSGSADGKNAADTSPETEAAPAAAAPAASDKGIGPVSAVDLGAGVDKALAEKGKAIFEGKCSACHKLDQRYVGPALAGVTERRKPEWIMNMILNPAEMVQKDDTAKGLLAEFMTPMPNQNLTQEEARAVLEYFRTQLKK